MVPWFIAFYASPAGEVVNSRTETVSAAHQVGIQTLEVTHTSGVHARDGDRLTIRYRFVSGGRTLANTELLGSGFTFTLGEDLVPNAVEDAARGLQLWATRKATVDATQLGPGFAERWPEVHGTVVFEITVVGLVRPGTP